MKDVCFDYIIIGKLKLEKNSIQLDHLFINKKKSEPKFNKRMCTV